MADIISVLVVLVFVVILFRKRLAPLFKGRKRQEDVQAAEVKAADVSDLPQKAEDNVYVHVFSIDVNRYSSMHDLSDAIETNLYDRLARIYNDHVGSFVGLDVITVNGKMVFLIRWHT